MRTELKMDLKKFFGHLTDTAVILFLPLLMMLLIESGMNVMWVAFIVGMYGAFMEGVLIINKKHMGTWSSEELDEAKAKSKGVVAHSAEVVSSVDNSELTDQIEAKKEGVSIEEFKEDKYGETGAKYDNEKAAALAQAQSEKEAADLKQLEALKQQYETTVPTPAPTPPPPVVEGQPNTPPET